MVIQGGFTNSGRTKRSEKQGREGIQLNAEFQRTARRNKKAFFNEQCLILEENNKGGKTGDLFRKIGNVKGAFFPKMGTTKDKYGRDLWKRSRRDGKNTRNNWIKKIVMDWITPMVWLVTHSEPNILECEVKWALESTAINKASGWHGIPVRAIQNPKS